MSNYKKLKELCIKEIKEEFHITPRVSNYLITFRVPSLDTKQIEILNNLSSMCGNVEVKPYKIGSLTIKLIFEL